MAWESVPFSQLYAADSRNGLTKPSKVRGSGFKMINMGELFANDRIYDIPMELVPLTESEKKNCQVLQGDLLFARQSLVLEGAGKCSVVMDVSPMTVFESHLIRVRLNQKIANPLFYYYFFRSPLSPVKTIVSQCAQAGIRGSDLQDLAVVFPPLDVQTRIADILSAYDSLIETNQRQIRLLEEAAQRLYREWFVDLRFPGHEDVPVVDGVPEGWKNTTMDNVCQAIGGGTPSTAKKEYYEGGTIRWVTPTDLTKTGSWVLLDTEKKITREGLDNSSAKMLPPNTILMTSRASIGYIAICEHEVCTNQGFISCIPHDDGLRYYLMFNLLNRVDEIKSKATGSTFLEIAKRTFRDLAIVKPSEDVIHLFNIMIDPLIGQIRNLRKQIEASTVTRDRLLPKIMSGEIDI